MIPAARLTDKHVCPIHGPNVITVVSTASTCEGLPIARVGDMTACGATILTGSAKTMVDKKPVAHIGSTTSHGGTIVTGSAKMLV